MNGIVQQLSIIIDNLVAGGRMNKLSTLVIGMNNKHLIEFWSHFSLNLTRLRHFRLSRVFVSRNTIKLLAELEVIFDILVIENEVDDLGDKIFELLLFIRRHIASNMLDLHLLSIENPFKTCVYFAIFCH